MSVVLRLMDYVETFPPDGDVDEFRGQLSSYKYHDLRTACRRFNLRCVSEHNNRDGFISMLVAYWMGEAIPTTEEPAKPDIMDEVTDVTDFVQLFPPESDIDEVYDQLNGCKARTLRKACVLLELRPKKNHAKPNFVGLLLDYWKDSVACIPKKVPTETPRTNKKTTETEDKTVKSHSKRLLEEVEKEAPQKKKKVVEHTGDLVEEEKSDAMAASLEKAKVVKEWASAIEILTRVDGSAESIASIQALIGGVVANAVSEL